MPTLRRDISVGRLGNVVGRDDFDEDFLEVVLGVFVTELPEGAFHKELPDWIMPMVSQSFSTSLMMWVEKMTVLPLSRHSRMKAVMVRAVMMSRPLVGSSKIMTGGSGR